jgi:hypothetical protein
MTLLELAERCEKATRPDWSLDCDIARARGYYVPSPPTGGGLAVPTGSVPRYTASLDAAMNLVPEGSTVGLSFGPAKNSAFVVPPGADLLGPDRLNSDAKAATPVLALCAAALKARAASADTLPKGQDAKQGLAGTEGGAVDAEGSETPND